jgi:chemotaxis protein MotB
MKKKRPQAPVNIDRWLISYADFITLLFSFFVVMFAAAYDSDDSKAQHLAKAVSTAFSLNVFQQGGTQVFGKKMYAMGEGAVLDARSKEALSMSDKRGDVEMQKDMSVNAREKFEPVNMVRDQVTQEFYNELKKLNIHVTMESRGLVVSFAGVASFDAGSDAIRSESLPLIEKVVRVIKDRRNLIQIEGHSDGTGMDKEDGGSNMELSARRAEAVAKLLIRKYGIPAEYISSAGYGPFRPAGDNANDEGRAMNRRADLILLKTVPDENHIALPRVRDGERAPETQVAVDLSYMP